MKTIVAYDVSDDGTRAKLAALLGSMGERLQRSVFQCELSDEQLAVVLRRADTLIDHDGDSVHLFAQCTECDPKCAQSVKPTSRTPSSTGSSDDASRQLATQGHRRWPPGWRATVQ
jgi:CRISPR-associated protein Cas2